MSRSTRIRKNERKAPGISLHKYFIGPNCVHKSANGLFRFFFLCTKPFGGYGEQSFSTSWLFVGLYLLLGKVVLQYVVPCLFYVHVPTGS